MSTAGGEDHVMGENLDRLSANLAKMEELSQRMVTALSSRPASDAGLEGPGPELYMKAGMAYWHEMMTNPAKLMENQVQYWGEALTHFMEAQQELARGSLHAPEDDGPEDKRFQNPMWKSHPYFNFIKQQYLISAQAIERAIADLDNLPPRDKQRVEFFARQIIDLFAPTNFLATNPDALERAVETDGASLVQGLENLVRDIEANRGAILPTLSDPEAFTLGQNIGTAKGSVVFRNEMMELIQFAPTTEQVHRTPIVVLPPWINKFYILDLKESNSLIRWIVDQGYTLFVVSWKNPDTSYADTSLDDYVEKGYLEAIATAKAITGEKQINAIGYCIAGTTLAAVLSLLKKRKDNSIKSATFFTALTDFSEQGEFTPFLDDDFVDAIERQVTSEGILGSHLMSRTFSFLRANDLVYGPAVRSYMMGEAPPAFDLLFWNGDSTNLPGRMAVQYLRDLCQGNKLALGELQILGETLSLSDVTLPVCSIACETDHIAAWPDVYRGLVQFASKDKTFILSESGHIAGIVNPPTKKKYGHYTNTFVSGTPEEWRESATYNQGSWWPMWERWIAPRSGAMVPARTPGEVAGFEPLGDAPGTYVLEKAAG
ncbi:class I poly(R)-hydroxyalkanoic acid synthase [Rhodobacterales bacterium HKCCE2091]|nr:class I poly(R)-hydroxyalkanoic acid synthase [Rhodobacterales bacterium HKCCE2091]